MIVIVSKVSAQATRLSLSHLWSHPACKLKNCPKFIEMYNMFKYNGGKAIEKKVVVD